MNTDSESSRRKFLSHLIPICAFSCFSCKEIFAGSIYKSQHLKPEIQDDPFQADSKMTMEEVFEIAHRVIFIPQLLGLARQMGREKLIEQLMDGSSWAFTQDHLQNLISEKFSSNYFINHIRINETVERTETVRAYNVVDCLHARMFRKEMAEDLGYAALCHPDFAVAKKKNLKLTRTKTLMQGDDVCDFRYEKLTV